MSKQTTLYKVKSFALKVADVDEPTRRVSGYLSAFNVLDSDKDRILPGAFKQSLKMRGPQSSTNRKIAYLRMHDWNKQIGKFTELEEDSFGLKFVAQMGRSSQGEDAFRDYQDEVLREHSIGFNYVKDGITYSEENDEYTIKELKLWEGSAVTFGSNEFTPVLSVSKSADKIDAIAKLNEEFAAITGALKNGKGSDERLYNLEMQLRVIQTKTNALLNAIDSAPKKAMSISPKAIHTAPKGSEFLLNFLQNV